MAHAGPSAGEASSRRPPLPRRRPSRSGIMRLTEARHELSRLQAKRDQTYQQLTAIHAGLDQLLAEAPSAQG